MSPDDPQTGPLRGDAQPPFARGATVCFVPMDAGNPYQPKLAAHLEQLGIHVKGRAQLRGLVWESVRARRPPSIVHLHWLPRCGPGLLRAARAVMFLFRLVALRLLGSRLVWTVHNLYSHESSWRWADRWFNATVAALAARLIAHSPTAARIVRDEFNVSDALITVVPHGNYIGSYDNTASRQDARERLGLSQHAVVLLFFGNIRPYKGVPELIAAYRTGGSPGAMLLIAGRPLNEATAVDIGAAIDNDPRIRFDAGLVPDHRVQEYMNACDAVVFPYQDVLTSGAVVLAMSFGRACIAPALGCIPDLLDDRGAFLYPAHEPHGLRDALRRAIDNSNRLAAMGAHNLDRAREWGWDSVAQQTAVVYAAALGECSPTDGSPGSVLVRI